jgi:hypothetical protein
MCSSPVLLGKGVINTMAKGVINIVYCYIRYIPFKNSSAGVNLINKGYIFNATEISPILQDQNRIYTNGEARAL